MKIKEKLISKIPEKHREPLSKAYHISKKIKNIVCWIVVIVLAAGIISFMFVRVSGGTPELFGYSIQRIVSGSMEPELKIGDVILSKKVDDVSTLKVGDIITFKGGPEYDYNRVTHRVYVAPHMENGVYYLTTKGDANSVTDNPIKSDSVESIFIGKANAMKSFFDFFVSPWGLIIFIALILLLFFDEIINIVRAIKYADDNENLTDEEKLSEIIERLKKEEEEKQHYNKDGYLLKHLEDSKEFIKKLEEREKNEKDTSEEESNEDPLDELSEDYVENTIDPIDDSEDHVEDTINSIDDSEDYVEEIIDSIDDSEHTEKNSDEETE